MWFRNLTFIALLSTVICLAGCGGGIRNSISGSLPITPGVTATASPTTVALTGGQAQTTLTCSATGELTSLEGRCDTNDAWTAFATGTTTLNCAYTATGTFTPGCQFNGTMTDDVNTSVSVITLVASASPVEGDTGDTFTLTCTVSGPAPALLEGRCHTTDSWSAISSGATMNCAYSSAGSYTPGCRVNSLVSDDADTSIAVSLPPNQLPTASAGSNVTIGLAPLAVQFTGSGADSDGTIASYAWTFGDGNSSTQQSPSHTYSSAGAYTATLTVTDDRGGIATDTVSITVTCGLAGAGVCIGHTSGTPGSAISIPVKLLNASGVAGVTLVIAYDQTKLTAAAPTNGNLIPNALFISNTAVPGEIRIAIAGATGYTGSGDLATLNFTINAGAAAGQSDVTFTSVELSDVNGSAIGGATSSDGSIIVE